MKKFFLFFLVLILFYPTNVFALENFSLSDISSGDFFGHDIESGTTVIWKNLIKFQRISQSEIEDEFGSDAHSLIKHIALHFHKFISGPKSIKILVNKSKSVQNTGLYLI